MVKQALMLVLVLGLVLALLVKTRLKRCYSSACYTCNTMQMLRKTLSVFHTKKTEHLTQQAVKTCSNSDPCVPFQFDGIFLISFP